MVGITRDFEHGHFMFVLCRLPQLLLLYAIKHWFGTASFLVDIDGMTSPS